jgi:hypothetical protein
LGFVSVTTSDGTTPFDGSGLVIDGGVSDFAAYVATIQNPGAALGSANTPVILQGWVQQGTTRRAAGGTVLTCASQGVLPSGTCVQNGGASPNDIQAAGSGTFAVGSATLVLELWSGSVGSGTLLATKSIPITLAAGFGTIQGTVRDATGAAIAGASVTAVLGDGAPHSAQTNADGFYQISQLTPGIYNLSVSAGNIAIPNAQGVVILADTPTVVNFAPIVIR